MKKAFITGISGQDGSYLSELLLGKGYEVHGMVRRISMEDPKIRLSRIRHLLEFTRFVLHSGSLESYASILKLVDLIQPDECYHLAAQSFAPYSFDDEFSTMNTNVNGTHNVLSAIKARTPKCKVYFAASSEMFGNAEISFQDENTSFSPRSSYGISKVAGYHLTKYYREAWDIFACNGILFNHESPRRGMEYVTRKITTAVARIKLGIQKDKLVLGNIEAYRDWGHAIDYVRAMWLMLQRDVCDDYVIATGESHSVREFLDVAFSYVDLDYKEYIEIDADLFRPAEIFELKGNAKKARKLLGWQNDFTFVALVKEMVDSDLRICTLHQKEGEDKWKHIK